VTEFSIDPNSRALGGVIPPIPRHAGNEKLEEVVFKLKENEISSVVQVGVNQYMIVLCEGRTEQVVTELTSDVETMLRDQLTEEKVQQSVAKVFENLKDNARVENILTGTVQGGEKKPAAAARKGAVKPAAGAAGKSAGDVTGVSGEVEAKPAPRAAGKPKAPATK